MKYPRILWIFSVFIFIGIGVTGIKHVGADEWTPSYEAFTSTNDQGYHQRHNGVIDWHLFHDTHPKETKSGHPKYTDVYWIEGDLGWQKRIMAVEGTSELSHLTPANVAASKYHSPCPLCGFPTYFWVNTGDLDDIDVQAHIKGDFPGWSKADGVCRNCFECYELRTGKYFDGKPAASSTDEYVIGYNKSANIQDYFANVK